MTTRHTRLRPAGNPLPDPEEPVTFAMPEGTETVPMAADAGACPPEHISFEQFWRSLGLPSTPESVRESDLFYEWLGQAGYGVDHRDEPTILGDAAGWREAWTRWQRERRLH